MYTTFINIICLIRKKQYLLKENQIIDSFIVQVFRIECIFSKSNIGPLLCFSNIHICFYIVFNEK